MTTGPDEPPRHPPATPRPLASGPEYPAPGSRPAPARTPPPAEESGPAYPVPRQPNTAPGGRRPVRPSAGGGPSDAWRAGHSLWLLLPLVNLGWVGFLVIGGVAGNRVWRKWAVGYASFWLFASILNAASGSGGASALAVLAWLAPLVHGGLINKEFLRQVWTRRTGQPYPGDPVSPRELTFPPPAPAPAAVAPAAVGSPDPTDRLPARLSETMRLARGPRFPAAAARQVLAIAELLRPVLDEQRAGRLTGAQWERFAAIVEEYLPQVVEAFLRLPDSYLDQGDRRARMTAELGQQLDELLEAAKTLQSSVFADEADEFRSRVLFAYREQCSICRLRHAPLLDAAHITPDSDPDGLPVVPNGLAMCKIHHAAYDADIIGIRPDLTVDVRADVLAEIDGPMLRHGQQEMRDVKLLLPRSREARPDIARVARRWERFRLAG